MADTSTPKPNKGPQGLGDPDDRTLRIVEKEVLIPKIMRDKAKTSKCLPEVQEFTKCCSENKLLMAYYCREENAKMQDCQAKWYQDQPFIDECTEIYLNNRRKFRLTGIPNKRKDEQFQ